MQKKGNAYLDGTVHVGKEVQTIQRYKLEPYMWEKRYKPGTGTVHVGKEVQARNWNRTCGKMLSRAGDVECEEPCWTDEVTCTNAMLLIRGTQRQN